MSERVICEKSDLVAIANSVREVTGSTDTYNIPQLKEYIADTIKPVSRAVPGLALDTSNGVITAETNQEQGYVAAGQESITMSLPTQGATTITPTTEPQTAVSAGTYVTGDIVVEAAEGGGTAADDVLKALIGRTITEIEDSNVTSIGGGAFYSCPRLTSVNFPMCTSIGNSAFYNCPRLTSVNFPMCTSIGNSAFANCTYLTPINFPVCTSIGYYAFYECLRLTSVNLSACTHIGNYAFADCTNLTSVNFPMCTNIGYYVFHRCYYLSSLTLGASTVCTLANSNAFNSTPFAGYSGSFSGTPYIYVPASLLTSYQTATNWAYFSSYFSTIESLEGTT